MIFVSQNGSKCETVIAESRLGEVVGEKHFTYDPKKFTTGGQREWCYKTMLHNDSWVRERNFRKCYEAADKSFADLLKGLQKD